ncbi:MAG TPA: hypothetical protein PKW42_03365 [bacterium]|mgnify:CR=1 FL=1|nr:hypothetical protein [bacterium]
MFAVSCLVCLPAEKSLLPVKDTTVTIPVEEFSQFMKNSRVLIPWEELQKFLVTDGTGRYLRLPWETFLKFVEEKKPAAPKPPADYILSSFLYSGTPGQDSCNLKFSGNLFVLKDPAEGWTTVKLWPANLNFLSSLTVNGKPGQVLCKDGAYCLLLNETGSFRIEGQLQIRLTGETLRFWPPVGTASIIKLTLPPDYDFSAPGAATVSLARTTSATEAEATFSSVNAVEISWSPVIREPQQPKILSSLLLQYSLQPDLIRTTATVKYEILYQPVTSLQIKLPEGVRLINVSGNLIDWKETDSLVQVELKPKTKGQVQVYLTYEQELKPTDNQVRLTHPLCLQVEKTTGYATVVSTPSLEVSPEQLDGLVPVDPREIPGATTPAVLAMRFSRLPFSGSLKLLRHEEIPVLEATADSANAITALTLDGKSITRVIFNLRNNSQQFLRVRLPEKAQLWSVYVDQSPTKPLVGAAGEVLVPVLKSASRSERAMPVEIIYYLPGTAFSGNGFVEMSLPVVNVPIMHFMYSFYVPEKLVLSQFSGNLEQVKNFTVFGEEGAEKIPAAGPAKPVEAKFKDRSPVMKEEQGKVYLGQQLELERNISSILLRTDVPNQPAGGAGETTAGLLPLRIYIPATGQLLRFEKRLVIEEELKLKARYALRR